MPAKSSRLSEKIDNIFANASCGFCTIIPFFPFKKDLSETIIADAFVSGIYLRYFGFSKNVIVPALPF